MKADPVPDRLVVDTILAGRHLYLRRVRVKDVNERYRAWMNDRDVCGYLESRFQPHSITSLRNYVLARTGSTDVLFLAIVLKEGDRHIGNIKLGPIDWNHRLGDIGLLIGEKDCWGRGYATEAIELLVHHAFTQLDLHKLTAGCYADNQASIRAFLKAGFSQEGVRKSHYCCDGRYVDAVLLGILRPESQP